MTKRLYLTTECVKLTKTIPCHLLPFWLRPNLSCHQKVTKELPLSTQKLYTRKLGQNSNIKQIKATQRKHSLHFRGQCILLILITLLLFYCPLYRNIDKCAILIQKIRCTLRVGMYWIWALCR